MTVGEPGRDAGDATGAPGKRSFLRRHAGKVVGGVVVLAVLAVLGNWFFITREGPDRDLDSDEARFLYGSVGTEAESGLPFDMWIVLPELFPEHLDGPASYETVGLVWVDGEETPVGITRRSIGTLSRAGINCALCHSTTYRVAPEDDPVVVPGGPANRFDLQAYLRFLTAAANDDDFTAENFIDAISQRKDLSALDRMTLRAVVPITGRILRAQGRNFGWMDANPDWGPGRIDPFNPVKFSLLGQPEDGTIGNSDMMPIWDLADRPGGALHWDGLNTSATEVARSGAIGDGATARSLDTEFTDRLEAYLADVDPPAFPYPIDEGLATEGRAVFRVYCAECHANVQARTGRVIPQGEVGTDPNRVAMWTDAATKAYNNAFPAFDFDFDAFQNVEGYVAVELDGIWIRAPYLHNGSVPTLFDLLEHPDDRPDTFFRGYDVYDPERMGFVTDVEVDPATGRRHFLFDTSLPGNSNAGHLYGVDLSDRQKAALVEYMKTL